MGRNIKLSVAEPRKYFYPTMRCFSH